MTGRRALFWGIVLAIAGIAAIEAVLDLVGERWLAFATTPVSAGGLGWTLSPFVLDLLDLPVTLGLAILVAGWLSRRLTRPLRTLTRATEQLANEQFPEPLPVPEGDDDLARLARSFNRMSAALRALVDRERTLTRYATHELRTPLSALKLQVERAQRHATEPNPTLDAMARNVRRMEEVIGALLQLTRSGERDRTPAALVDVIEETFAALSPTVRSRVDLMSLPPDVRITDGALVQRALHNLIGNALAHGAVPGPGLRRSGRRAPIAARARPRTGRPGGRPDRNSPDRSCAAPPAARASGSRSSRSSRRRSVARCRCGTCDPGFEASLRLPIVVDD